MLRSIAGLDDRLGDRGRQVIRRGAGPGFMGLDEGQLPAPRAPAGPHRYPQDRTQTVLPLTSVELTVTLLSTPLLILPLQD